MLKCSHAKARVRVPSVFVFRSRLPKLRVSQQPAGPVTLDGVPKEYHGFTDVFSKSKAGILANHRPYDLKITLEDRASPPLGPIYSLSQEELLALRKFIDENTATGFIRPSCSPHGAPVLFIWKKDGSLRLCCDFRGIKGLEKGPVPTPADQ